MWGAVLLEAGIDISIPSTTPEQRLIAWGIIVLAGLLIAYVLYRSAYAGLPRSLKESKGDIRGARADTPFQSVYLSASEAINRGRVRQAATNVLEDDVSEQASLHDAAGSLREELAATWAPYFVNVPRVARRVGALGLAVAVLGLVAVSTEVLLAALRTSTPGVRPARWPFLAVSQTVAVLGAAGGAISSVPVLGDASSMVFALAFVAGAWVYSHWFVSATCLLVGAAAITYLTRRLDRERDLQWIASLPTPWQAARVAGFGVGLVWGITLLGIGAGRMLGPAQLGRAYGLAAFGGALVAVLLVAVIAAYRSRDRLAALHDRWQTASRRERAYLLVRGVTLTVAVLVGPLVPIYAVVAVTKVPTLLAAYAAADVPIQVIGAGVTIVVAVALGWQAQEAWGDIASALRITAARRAVRSTVVAGGVPIGVVAVTYALVAGLSKSIPLGVIVAVGAGLVVRQGIQTLTRAKYKASFLGGRRTTANRVVLEGAPLTLRDGSQLWYLRVNGATELLHADREPVVTAAADVASGLVENGDAPPTIPEWHARFAFDVGVTDPEETLMKLTNRAHKHVWHPLRKHDGVVPIDHLADEVDRFPDEIVVAEPNPDRGLLAREANRGNLRVGEEYVELLNDPYAK